MLSNKMPELALQNKAKLILSERLLNHIDYAHKLVGSLEWMGFLFYKQIEGDFTDINSLVFEAFDFLPCDIGTSGHTEFTMTPEVEDNLYEIFPNFREYNMGLIHTH